MSAGADRRRLLIAGAAAVGGAVAGGAAGAAGAFRLADAPEPGPVAAGAEAGVGDSVVACHGDHQAGVETPAQAFGAFVGLDLLAGADRGAVGRLLRLLSDDVGRLTTGRPALADTEPELAGLPARLTVTLGFGARLFTLIGPGSAGAGDRRWSGAGDLPAFGIDRLEPRWCGGDLLLQVCADDQVTVAHALRVLIKDARAFASVRWVQRGFRRSAGVQDPATTQRNLMGQIDGTTNPVPGTPAFAAAVWIDDGPAWLRGGTTLVLRRIRMDLEGWDQVDRDGREFAVGRRLGTGAPLTGTAERDEPDLAATTAAGLPVISEFAHIRRAHVADPTMRIFRRVYNYDDAVDERGRPDTGLLFASYQASVERQFVPVQTRLAEVDLLNRWTTPVGSAVFTIPPGFAPGGWVGQDLLG